MLINSVQAFIAVCSFAAVVTHTAIGQSEGRIVQSAAGQDLDKLEGVAVPFEYDPVTSPYIVVKARISGSAPLRFGVDTGFTGTLLLFDWAAAKLDLKPVRSVPTESGPGRESDIGPGVTMSFPRSALLDDISVNGTIPTLLVHGPELENFKRGTVAGVIGLQFFTKSTVAINFQEKRLTFVPGSHAALNPASGTVVPLIEREPDRLYIPVKFADGREELLLLDTGSPMTEIPEVHALHVPQSGSTLQGQKDFDGTAHISTNILADHLSIGSLTIDRVPLFVKAGKEWVIGTDVLRRFHVTIDYRNKQLLLQPGGGLEDARELVGSTGLDVDEDERGFYIKSIAKKGAADKASVKEGATLMSVNGDSLTDLPLWSVKRLVDGIAGRPLRLRLRDLNGKERETVLIPREDYSRNSLPTAGVRLTWKPSAAMAVESIQPDSKAFKQGLREGDVISLLNGKPTLTQAFELLFKELLGRRVKMHVQHTDGRTETITLEAEKKK